MSRVRSIKVSDLAELLDRTFVERDDITQMQRRIDKLVEALDEMKERVRQAEERAAGLPSAFSRSRPRLDTRDVQGERRDMMSELFEFNRDLK